LNPGHFSCFTFILCFIGESHLLVSWCAGGRCDMVCSDEDHDRSRRLVQMTGDGHINRVLGGQAIKKLGGALCGLHRARRDKELGFLG
jgi:hypothetical protein